MSNFADRLAQVQERITAALARAHRSAEELSLVAISKGHPPAAIAEAVAAGQYLFGESRVQEARAKQEKSPSRAAWHFIGHLQKNKIRAALPCFDLFHGVDSPATAEQMARIAGEESVRPRLLLEVNVAGEGTKYGFKPETLPEQMEALLALPHLTVEGLMAIPPAVPESEKARPHFAELRELRDTLEEEFGIRLPTLSMGMSGDYAVAIEEGATLVRVGTALFGRRPPRGTVEE